MADCRKCDYQEICEKASYVENYDYVTLENCRDYHNFHSPETILTLIKLFTELEEILDNNSICILNIGEISPTQYFEANLVNEIENLRCKYIGR